MVKKAKTNKPKPTTVKDDDVICMKVIDFNKLAYDSRCEIDKRDKIIGGKEALIDIISAQRDLFKQQRNQITEQIMDVQKQRDQARKACELEESKSKDKDALFYSMCELRNLTELEAEALEKELAKAEKKLRLYRAGFYIMSTVTLAVIMLAKLIH
jgi:hypothetical protein